MRLKDFPLAIEVDGAVWQPAMLAAFDEVTQVWALVDGQPAIVASGPALAARARVDHGSRLVDGKRARWAAELIDGTSWPVGHSPECCGCRRHPLCRFTPPEPVAAALSEEVNA